MSGWRRLQNAGRITDVLRRPVASPTIEKEHLARLTVVVDYRVERQQPTNAEGSRREPKLRWADEIKVIGWGHYARSLGL